MPENDIPLRPSFDSRKKVNGLRAPFLKSRSKKRSFSETPQIWFRKLASSARLECSPV